MGRRYDETIEVRLGDESAGQRPGPSAFLWRGRLYVVREVLGHWRERRAWWTEGAARALLGVGGSGAPGDPQESTDSTDSTDENEVWRVEASTGRLAVAGVYDIAGSGTGASRDGRSGWLLRQVAD